VKGVGVGPPHAVQCADLQILSLANSRKEMLNETSVFLYDTILFSTITFGGVERDSERSQVIPSGTERNMHCTCLTILRLQESLFVEQF
jgi:hypothetical protein